MQERLVDDLQRVVSYIEAVFRTVLHRPPEIAEAEKYAKAIYDGLSPVDFFHIVSRCDERRAHAKLFAVPGSYQSPVANPAELQPYVRGLATAGPALAGIAIDRAAMIAVWDDLLPFLTTCPLPSVPTPGFAYYAENAFFALPDALVLQAMLRRHAPKRYVEIGSGFSSACAIDTIEHFLNGSCATTFIEPQPQRLLGVLGDRARGSRIFDVPVQAVPPAFFEELEAGDVLFIDSSHVLRTGSDVCFELFEILPRLAAGVFVHVHDVLWPFDYPESWILRENRSYNEAYAVRAFLTGNADWTIAFFNDYFAKFEWLRIAQSFPGLSGTFGGSLWLQRR
jgi:hypothetical protein